MSITRLQQARQMYALGKLVERVGFRRGGTGGGTGDAGSPGTNADGSNANTGGGDNDYNFRGPADLGVTTRTVDTISPPDVDRSAVGQFSTYGRNLMNQNLKGPSVFSQIGTGIKDYITGGGLIGAGIRGLTGLFDKVTGPKATEYGNLNTPGYNMLNIAGPKSYDFGPGPGEGNDNQGIMAAYNPYLLPEEEVPISQEEEDFKHRYAGLKRTKLDKEGLLDPAILDMINKLYT